MNLNNANTYFSNRLNTTVWDNASDLDKQKALTMAYNNLEQHENRVDNTRFNYAVYEQALWLLSGDSRSELQKAGVSSMSLSKMSESYDLKGRDPFIAPEAWRYLRGPSVKAGGLK